MAVHIEGTRRNGNRLNVPRPILPQIHRLQIAYTVHSVNHVTALNQRKHSIFLKNAKEARSNGVLHVHIFVLTAKILTYRPTDCRRITRADE